jgi:hypothetical protein
VLLQQLALAGIAAGLGALGEVELDADLDLAAARPEHGVELGRFVLLDEEPANAETWFLARAFKVLRAALALPGPGWTRRVQAGGTGALRYQWRRNGLAVAGATTAKGVSTAAATLDGTDTAVDLFLNFLVDDTDHDVTTTPANLIVSGTITLHWINLGDK